MLRSPAPLAVAITSWLLAVFLMPAGPPISIAALTNRVEQLVNETPTVEAETSDIRLWTRRPVK